MSFKLRRYIIQNNKIYHSKQQDIFIEIGMLSRQDCKSYQNDWRILP